jgi:hypothetical protein
MMNPVVTSISIIALVLALAAAAEARQMQMGEVLVFTAPALKPDADSKAFESHVAREIAARSKSGARSHLLRADRGSRKGQYVVVTATTARQSGGSPVDFGTFVQNAGRRAEYQLIGAEQVGQLPTVEVLGIHSTRVPAERRDAFERFVREKVHPAVANLRPDLRILYYKPVGGDADPNRYLAIFALTSVSRDKYWPGGSDSDELRAAFKPVQPLTKELRTYLVEGSYLADEKFAAAVYESRDWSDFVLVSPQGR